MVVRFEHMWLSIPALLIPMVFVILIMGLIKIWMYGAPQMERIIPSYSLHVMKDLPSYKEGDKPKTKTFVSSTNPYAHGAKPKTGMYTRNKPPQYTYSAEAQMHRPVPQYPREQMYPAPQPGYNMPRYSSSSAYGPQYN